MRVSYRKLWKLLIDLNMTKTELRENAGIGKATFTKFSKDETVSMDILIKICDVLDCDFGDIVEIVPLREEVNEQI